VAGTDEEIRRVGETYGTYLRKIIHQETIPVDSQE